LVWGPLQPKLAMKILDTGGERNTGGLRNCGPVMERRAEVGKTREQDRKRPLSVLGRETSKGAVKKTLPNVGSEQVGIREPLFFEKKNTK